MAHHHHNHHHLSTHLDASHSLNPIINASSGMPAISEDDLGVDFEEPPDHLYRIPQPFQKSKPTFTPRRESLLTQSLLSESESTDNNTDHFVARQPSRSSTCSTFSDHSYPLTSDDGLVSPSTRASSPGASPHVFLSRKRPSAPVDKSTDSTPIPARVRNVSITSRNHHLSPSEMSEPVVEEQLGRKRCITFACGGSKKENKSSEDVKKSASQDEPPKRACTIKFACPSKWGSSHKTVVDKETASTSQSAARHGSPAPSKFNYSGKLSSPVASRRGHRDSDTTIKNDSPKSYRKSPVHLRRPSNDPDMGKCEATRFHEFASSDEERDDWTQERTVYKSRLTVDDTLKKETIIRNITEKAEEEALEEEELEAEMQLSDEDEFDDDLSDITDEGFQTDNEEGFAESDDDEDDDSDYEWWAPRGRSRGRSPAPATMLPMQGLRPNSRDASASSAHSDSSNVSPAAPLRRLSIKANGPRQTRPVKIRPSSPDLPDSTDFVCGTLDEDRPLEQAFMNSLHQRKAAKHRPTPQDIDPTFPTSDPDMNSDEEEDEEDEVLESIAEESDAPAHNYLQGGFENLHGEAIAKRPSPKRPAKGSPAPLKRVPSHTKASPPKRTNKSPAPLKRVASHKASPPQRAKSPAPLHRVMSNRKPSPAPTAMTRGRSPQPRRGRSPAPKALFDTVSRRLEAPRSESRPLSPPPSRRGSDAHSPNFRPVAFGTAFLGHRPQLTHTSSLPRSHGLHGYRVPSVPARLRGHHAHRIEIDSKRDDSINEEEEDDDAEDDNETAREDNVIPYARGAIDIVQGLERKRLRRRQKFMEKYQRKEDKKRARGELSRRPRPGQGAERMRQIGIECAVYRGKRVLSV